MANYTPVGHYDLDYYLKRNVVGAWYKSDYEFFETESGIALVFHEEGTRYWESPVPATILLQGHNLKLNSDGTITGEIAQIDFYVNFFEYFAGRLSDAEIEAHHFQETLDLVYEGQVDPFKSLFFDSVDLVVGTGKEEYYKHQEYYPATNINLRGGDDRYTHYDSYFLPEGFKAPSLVINGGRGGDDFFYTDQRGDILLNFSTGRFVDVHGTRHRVRNFEAAQAGNGDDTLIGALDKSNRFFGKSGDDLLQGGDAQDTLVGDSGNDVLLGKLGDDLIRPGSGVDTIDGGGGNDTVSYSLMTLPLDARYISLRDQFASYASDRGTDYYDDLKNIENVVGTRGSDTIIGDSGDNLLDGDEFHDVVRGLGGSDTLLGGEGRDRLWGQRGRDEISGGAEDDTLVGGRGADTLDGGDGNDSLVGGTGRDLLFGGEGDDTLQGGVGKDRLEGGAGRDTFVFLFSDTGTDKVIDFDTTEDILDISSWGAGGFLDVSLEITVSSGGNARLEVSYLSQSFLITNISEDEAASIDETHFIFV